MVENSMQGKLAFGMHGVCYVVQPTSLRNQLAVLKLLSMGLILVFTDTTNQNILTGRFDMNVRTCGARRGIAAGFVVDVVLKATLVVS